MSKFLRRLLYCNADCGTATKQEWEVVRGNILRITCTECYNWLCGIEITCSHNKDIPSIVSGGCDICIDAELRRYMDEKTRHCPDCGTPFAVVSSGYCHQCGFDMKLCVQMCEKKPNCRCYQDQRTRYVNGKPDFVILNNFFE